MKFVTTAVFAFLCASQAMAITLHCSINEDSTRTELPVLSVEASSPKLVEMPGTNGTILWGSREVLKTDSATYSIQLRFSKGDPFLSTVLIQKADKSNAVILGTQASFESKIISLFEKERSIDCFVFKK